MSLCVCATSKNEIKMLDGFILFEKQDKIDPKHSKMPKAEADTYFLV